VSGNYPTSETDGLYLAALQALVEYGNDVTAEHLT
jgi:hypothetical protein